MIDCIYEVNFNDSEGAGTANNSQPTCKPLSTMTNTSDYNIIVVVKKFLVVVMKCLVVVMKLLHGHGQY